MMAEGNSEVVFPKRPLRMALDVLLLLFWGAMAVVFAAGLLANDSDIEDRTSFIEVALMAAVVIAGILYLIRIMKVRGPLLRITPVGFFYPLHGPEIVPWSDIAAITVERGRRWTYSSYVYLFLKNGTLVEIECEFFTLNLDRVVQAIRLHCAIDIG
jgi:hypothetical protein